MADDDQYAGSDTPQTADEQKKSDQDFLAKDQAPQPAAPKPAPESDSGGQLPNPSDLYRFGLKLYTDSEDQIEKNNARLQPLYEKLNKSLSQPLPQVPQFQKVPPPPSQQQLNQRLNQGRFSYLAIGLPLALLLGRRGKNAAWYAMGAFGEGLNQLQKNNVQGARDMFETWQEAAKYAQEENNQRLETYKLVLENRNLTLNQQTTLMESLSRQFNDPYIHRAAVAKDMITIAGELAKAESQGGKFAQETDKLSIESLEEMGRTPEGQSYRQRAQKAGGPDPFDWRDSQKRHKGDLWGNYKEAQKSLPYDEFNKKYNEEIKGTGLGLDDDQQYKNENKALGLEEEPHVDNKEAFDKLPSGARWKAPGDGYTSWHGPKP